MIIDELQKANIEAMKSGDKIGRAIISVVISKYKALAIELKSQGKDIADSDMVKIISKSVKELDEEKGCYLKANRTEEVNSINMQKALIEKFLPQLMGENEIRNIISSLEDKSMPSIMKHFKNNYDGQVDMGLVSKIAREQ